MKLWWDLRQHLGAAQEAATALAKSPDRPRRGRPHGPDDWVISSLASCWEAVAGRLPARSRGKDGRDRGEFAGWVMDTTKALAPAVRRRLGTSAPVREALGRLREGVLAIPAEDEVVEVEDETDD